MIWGELAIVCQECRLNICTTEGSEGPRLVSTEVFIEMQR